MKAVWPRFNDLVRMGRILAAVALVAALMAACTPPVKVDKPPVLPPSGPGVAAPTLSIRAGIEQIYITGATEGDTVRVTGPIGEPASATIDGRADSFGSFVARGLVQGADYLVEHPASVTSQRVRVLVATEHPDRSFYEATHMVEGPNYIPMRDGTLLAATVRPPIGKSLGDGPFPTLIEYSGYQVASPRDPFVAKLGGLLGFGWGNDPLVPSSSTDVGGIVARAAGYTVVSVQVRGTGCSGGEGDLFDLPGAADGYDAIETVATQPWVSNGRVGMIGISFSAFSQLATAATRPPHLSAIVPLSFAGRLWDVGWPGGIFNTGFAEGWLAERIESAKPAPSPGALSDANTLVATDPYCRENQKLRLQTRDGLAIFRDNTNIGDVYNRRDFVRSMARIDVPVFGSLQFQDEQTSASAMLGLDRLTPRNPKVWMTLSSGEHVDSVSPETLVDVFQFLDIYVARRSPELKLGLYLIAPATFGAGAKSLPLPDLLGLDLAEAQRRWEQRPTFRFGVEDAKGTGDGATGWRWSFRSASFPPAGTTVDTWKMGPGGTLTRETPADGQASWVADPGRRPKTTDGGWSKISNGYGLGFTSAPLDTTMAVVGPVAADLWVASTAADTDLQVTLSEVRPDGSEMFVNTGVQRASQRQIDPATDMPLKAGLTFTGPAPLDTGFNHVRVQVLPVGHAFRAGSRIRVTVGPLGGDKHAWRYVSVDSTNKPTDTLAFGALTPSSISLPLVAGAPVAPGLPPCPLKGQPCRMFTPASNGG